MKDKIFALVDCNSFYASCEKIFRPDIGNRPVIVLSNNDGCVVALTKDAKKLGIKRGIPLFQVQGIIKNNDVKVFSSNYELYGDISRRIMNILKDYSPNIEEYSIDEAFLDITGFKDNDLMLFSKEIKSRIQKGIKIPVSIGIGQTKTLAKLANKIGKDRSDGIFNIIDDFQNKDILKAYGVHDIWGIGFQYTKMLHRYNVKTIYDFINLDDSWVKKKMTIRGLLTLWELRGRHCIDLAESVPDKKQILSSRSFGEPAHTVNELRESIAFHVNIASRKLREQNSLCSTLVVFIATNSFKKDSPQYSNSMVYNFTAATDYTPDIIEKAHLILSKIYKDGFEYKRAGVMFTDLTYKKDRQFGLFEDRIKTEKKDKIIKAIDKINKYGNYEIIKPASYSVDNSWQMKRVFKSPNYTTSWEDLPLVKA